MQPALLKQDRNFQFLVASARDRMNPNGDGLAELEAASGRGGGLLGLSWSAAAGAVAAVAVVIVGAYGLFQSEWMETEDAYMED